MNGIGKGVAIAGIWIGVGIASFSPIAAGVGMEAVAVCAMVATLFTVLFF